MPPHVAKGVGKPSPLLKLTVSLLDTYQHINQVFYAKKTQRNDSEEAPSSHVTTAPSQPLYPPRKRKCNEEESASDKGWDDSNDDYIVRVGEVWQGRYTVLASLGKGSFGQVVKAYDRLEQTFVAIKIIKNRRLFYKQALNEIRILKAVDQGAVGQGLCVRLRGHFKHHSHLCLVFDLLDCNLYELLRKNSFLGLGLPVVRSIAKQLLMALAHFGDSEVSVIHCDLKPENIMLCRDGSDKIKVIDFGSSCQAGDKIYTYIQSRFYRSPEVILRGQYTMAIDMWSLGCVLAELLTGSPLFNGANEMDQINKMVEVLGIPPPAFLDSASKAKTFFSRRGSLYYCKPVAGKIYALPGAISLAAKLRKALAATGDAEAAGQLLDLISQMLVFNPANRITPKAALRHPFFTSQSTSSPISPLSPSANGLPPLEEQPTTCTCCNKKSQPAHSTAHGKTGQISEAPRKVRSSRVGPTRLTRPVKTRQHGRGVARKRVAPMKRHEWQKMSNANVHVNNALLAS